MPQLLSNVLRLKPDEAGYHVTIGLSPVLDKPELAALAFAVANYASHADALAAQLAGTMSTGKAKPVLDYYLSLNNDTGKTAMIHAIARSHLEPDRLEAFHRIWKSYRTAQKLRNPIAHWLWGTCSKLPDGLIAMDPHEVMKIEGKRDVIQHQARLKEREKKDFEAYALWKVDTEISYSYQNLFQVYREKDFRDIMRDLKAAYFLLQQFNLVVRYDRIEPAQGQQKYQQLIEMPEYRSLPPSEPQSC